MKSGLLVFFLLVAATSARAQGIADVSQQNISGHAQALALGSPFGQSFVPNSLQPLVGVGLATVDGTGAGDIQVSLYRSDAAGSSLLGSPLASGSITVAQIESYRSGVASPLWFPVYFDKPYGQTPGEHLAFTISGGGTLDFYYASGSAYAGGRLLADGTKDLTFATLIPEPGTASLFLAGCAFALLGVWKRRNAWMRADEDSR